MMVGRSRFQLPDIGKIKKNLSLYNQDEQRKFIESKAKSA